MIPTQIYKTDAHRQESDDLDDPLASCRPIATLFIILAASCAVRFDPVVSAGTPISSRKPMASGRNKLKGPRIARTSEH